MTYAPTCPACRANDRKTFYKACAGCQERRRKAMQAFHDLEANTLPVPSVNGPPKEAV